MGRSRLLRVCCALVALIVAAPAGRVFDRSGVHLSTDDFEADKRIGGLIQAIAGYCDRVYDRAQANDMQAVTGALGDARKAIKDVHAFFTSRQAG